MRGRTERGFSLLEAVAALAILGLAGIAALGTLGGELRGADQLSRATPAAALARDRLAAIRLLPPEEMRLLPDSLRRGTFPAPFAGYRWEAEARPVSGEADLYEVTVTVVSEEVLYPLRTRLYRPVGSVGIPASGALP